MSLVEKIKKLRQLSGAGFTDCSSALKEAKEDIDKAIEILRIKGVSKASKKMSREAKEGVVAISGDEKKTSIIEVTDYTYARDNNIKDGNRWNQGEPYANRIIDIDILLYGNTVTNEERLIIPHPELHCRQFVLEPLCELAPGWMVPLLNQTTKALLHKLTPG